jgi:hypothetical protein
MLTVRHTMGEELIEKISESRCSKVSPPFEANLNVVSKPGYIEMGIPR